MSTGVLLLNFGGPQTQAELEPFLANLLTDVFPRALKPLAPFIARRRASRMQPLYEAIGYSPIVPDTLAQAAGVRERLGPVAPALEVGMMFSAPSISGAIDALIAQGADRLIALGLFPHWSFATSGAAYDMVHRALVARGTPNFPVHYAPAFFDHPDYVAAMAQSIREHPAYTDTSEPLTLVFSAHGVPVSYIRRGDPYLTHIQASVRAIVGALGFEGEHHLGWQSRFGPVRWLAPDTRDVLRDLARRGAKHVLVVPISFVGEHIETLDEIDRQFGALAASLGLRFDRTPALGTSPRFLDALASVVRDCDANFGRHRCPRALIAESADERTEKVCKRCGFERPLHITHGRGGLA